MKRLVGTSVKRPVGVIMIVLSILALGFVSLRNLPVDLFPDVEVPVAVVATSYPGAAPQEVENLVSKPLESQLSTIEGIDMIQSNSSPSSSLVMLMFQTGTNLDNAMLDVRESVDAVKAMLPDSANDPSVLRFDPQQIPVMFVGLTGADLDELQNIAETDVEPAFTRAPGVGSATINGGQEREIRLELNKAQLARYGLTPNQVLSTVQQENANASGGVLSRGDKELQIRIEGEYDSLDDINNTLISLPNGGQVKVSDVSTMVDSFKEMSSVTQVNGEEALVISILKQSDANTVSVADEVYKAMDDIQEELPEGVNISVVQDTSTFIRDAIDSVINNIIIGAVLSVLVLLLFLRSVRSTLVIGLSIPISIIAAFSLMYFTGSTINTLTMGGLALGIGMMVDSSIVILENIFSYKERGYSIKDAAIIGGSELGSAVFAATMTTLVVFLPIVFTSGIASELFTPLASTVSFSLVSSLIVALTLVPMLASKFLTNKKKKKRGLFKRKQNLADEEASSEDDDTDERVTEAGDTVVPAAEADAGDAPKKKAYWFDRLLGKLTSVYEKALRKVLRFRKTSLLTVFLLFIASFSLIPMIGGELIPASDQGQLSINVETPDGTRLQETEGVTNQVNEALQPYNDVIETNYLEIAGSSASGGVGSSAANVATFMIQLIPPDQRDVTTDQMMNEWQGLFDDIVGAEVTVAAMDAGLGTGSPLQVQLRGEENEVLRELADQVTWVLEDIEGVYNIESSATASRPEMQINVDRETAAMYGLTYRDISGQVELAFNGATATQYREDGDEIDVTVTLPEDERQSIADLENTTIQTPNGQMIPLSTVATLDQVSGPVEITRQNQERQINITADVEGNDLAGAAQAIEANLGSMNFPEGYDYSLGGQTEDMAESFADLAVAMVFAIFLVYAVMAIQFESMVFPFVIMFSMPTSVIGVLIGLFITNTSLSIPAFIGFIMLAGIVVNNAILLVEYINILRERGEERLQAIIESGKSRMRPILMTTITTAAAMIPLALGIGEGSETQQPLAVVIIFGLSFSTFFTLLLVPLMYTYMDDFSNFMKRVFSGKWRPRMPFKRKPKDTADDTGMNV
ncbi:efflux RND transporter permease subunit [Bacillaceae bacterium SIJ1]|uniref:efflux RND transporter permease subunit n=1 Tax=Litoribacterium kuwaitense TaxID=1398745 RepID=UPI0013ECA642|nr:efflux RND transporter permease subunit [Litoribacterium kuwaitense]NGP43949.1 efflux RND transporter permease subunit [Litoribacterium kuwaitense]